jgi:hypothetical protein
MTAAAPNPPRHGEGDRPKRGGGVLAPASGTGLTERLIPLRRADARHLPLQGRI